MDNTAAINLNIFSLITEKNFTPSSFDKTGHNKNLFSQIKQWINDLELQSTTIVNEDFIKSDEAVSKLDEDALDTESSNKIRIQLLARKYISEQLSSEEEARLQIEIERVKKLMPLVTEKDIKNVGDALIELKKIQKRNSKIRRYLRMK